MKIGEARRLTPAAIVPVLTARSDSQQLQQFHSWAHSPTSAVLLAIGWVVAAVVVFTPLGRKISGRSASSTLRAVVVVLGALGAVSWVSRSGLFTILMMVALWACAVWCIVTLIGPAMSRAGDLKTELDPEKRAELEAERAAAAKRGASLEHVLDEVEEERH